MDDNPFETPRESYEPPARGSASTLVVCGIVLAVLCAILSVLAACIWLKPSQFDPRIVVVLALLLFLYVRLYMHSVKLIQISQKRFGWTWLSFFYWPLIRLDQHLRPDMWPLPSDSIGETRIPTKLKR